MSEKTSVAGPRHIAIIPDGNRRWAKKRGLPTLAGHKTGFDTAIRLFETALELGIEVVTIWGFSTENWQRSTDEVGYLMKLYEEYAKKQWRKLGDQGVQVRLAGEIERLPQSLQKVLEETVERTKNNSRLILNICLSYGGRNELLRAVQKLVALSPAPEQITEEMITNSLDTAGLPDVDLVIRTSGEQRTSGYLPWQAAYAELYFTPVLFPDFTSAELAKAVIWFGERRRRFGK
jgi:undecaprenyl diphosphate synthase